MKTGEDKIEREVPAHNRPRRCLYCGRYFVPDRRTARVQKACSRPACAKARKQSAQAVWLRKNPTYFKNRYATYVKEWRRRKREATEEEDEGNDEQELGILKRRSLSRKT